MVAVTGANGLLGSFVVRTLLERGISCVAITRVGSDLSLLKDVHEQIIWRNADLLNPVSVEEALEGAGKVIHSAAIVSFNPSMRDKLLKTNVEGTKNIVNACLQNKVARLVHISSVAALGRQKGQTVIDETNKWVNNGSNTNYALSKYQSELEVYRGEEEGLSTVILNPSVILAPADWNKSSAKLFKYVWDEQPLYINSYLNVVDVRDVAEAAVNMLDSNIRGQRFILNGATIELAKFFTEIAKRFNKKPPSYKVPASVLPIAAFFESIRGRFTSKEPLITKETARLADTKFVYSSQKLENQIGFKFKSIDESLNWCCDYYLNLYGKK